MFYQLNLDSAQSIFRVEFCANDRTTACPQSNPLEPEEAMPKVTLKNLFASTAGIVALHLTVNTQPAQTFSLTYNFTVNITTGTYAGNSYTGAFSYDNSNLTGSGLEFVSPTQGNLGVLFNFLNRTYTQAQDRDAVSGFPRVYFRNGNLLGLSFLVVPPTANPGFFFVPDETPGFNSGFYLGSTDTTYGQRVGSIAYALQPDPDPGPGPNPCGNNSCPAVPEPTEIAGSLLALSLLVLRAKLGRKRVGRVEN
ncbi:hypothetical protein K9N68_05630 [Kovacikia minuta CCNUW1]|uniref:hypothetical protein n=1 Tax=Kovacikia minuta TaxID=2931930 RepID=UPI001CCD21AC|nr:hypothetical protein [Kovacikia minuta]UBF27428.1 hypothetical protein K9N68_05630 [Kovacikia minuta CCNUW1]